MGGEEVDGWWVEAVAGIVMASRANAVAKNAIGWGILRAAPAAFWLGTANTTNWPGTTNVTFVWTRSIKYLMAIFIIVIFLQ